MILSQYDIKARTPTAIKSQALADLLAQFPAGQFEPMEEALPGEMEDVMKVDEREEWKMMFDGSSTTSSGGAGIVLTSPEGKRISLSYKLDFPCTNNEAEYEALALGLLNAISLGVKRLCIEGDSKLIIEQSKGEFAVKEPALVAYREVIRGLLRQFDAVDMMHVPRASNRHADALATVASKLDVTQGIETFEVQRKIVPCTMKEILKTDETGDWREIIHTGLQNPGTASLATLKDFFEIDGSLFHRSSEGILTRCLGPKEANDELTRIHKGMCGQEGPPLHRRVQRYGYFWPQMKADATKLQKECSACQKPPDVNEVLIITDEDWKQPYIAYLRDKTLPACKKQAASIKRKVWKFTLKEDLLVRHGFSGKELLCLSKQEGREKLELAHEGECGEHQGGRKLFQHVLNHGFYWPTMEADAIEFAKKCQACQLHGNMIHAPQVELHAISTPWPFHTWTLDLIGPIRPPSNGNIWILAATECFTKWVEAVPLKKATGQNVARFIKENIICRFGIPNRILSDNGTPFINREMNKLTETYSISHARSSPYYPKGNGQSEATNKTILKILGRMVHAEHKTWSQTLSNTLWAYRTSERSATGYTPFSLVYGSEAITPMDLSKGYNDEAGLNDQAIAYELEKLDERRDNAAKNNSVYRARIARAYEKIVRFRGIKEGDWVLKAAPFMMRNVAAPKFSAKWEGPYIVHEASTNGYYKLYDPRAEQITGPINAKWVKLYHV